MGALLEGERHEARPGRIEVLVHAPLGMHAVEASDHVAVHHVHDGLGHGFVHALAGQHAFLDDDVGHRLAVLDDGHLVACLAVERVEVLGVAHGHDAHAIGAVVGLDDDERLFVDAVFLVLAPDLGQLRIHGGAKGLDAGAFAEVQAFAVAEERMDEPGVDAQELAEALGHLLVALEMAALAAHSPAGMQGRQQVLLVQFLQDAWRAGGQVVVEQDGAGVEVLEPQAALVAHDRLQRDRVAVGQRDGGRLLDLRADGAHAHVEPGHVEDALQLDHVREVERVAAVVLGDDEEVARLGADLLDRGHGGLHGQRKHLGREVVPASGKEVGVHGRELETGIADVHRGVERRGVLHPLEPEPALDRGHGVEDALF